MHRSTSGNLEEADNFGSMTKSGADLSRYQEQLMRERNSRTLNLRRQLRPSIGACGLVSHSKMFIATPPIVEPENAIEAVNSGDAERIRQLLQAVREVVARGPRLLRQLTNNREFLEALSGSLGSGFGPEAVVLLMELIEAIFPYSDQLASVFVDSGIFALQDLLCGENGAVVLEATSLIDLLSGNDFARNAILCMGVYDVLISLANSRTSLELTICCCRCLLTMFTTAESPVDPEVLIDAAKKMFDLLSIDSPEVVSLVLSCYTEMSDEHNEYATLVFTLYDLGLFPLVVGFLDDRRIAKSALKLIGNLAVAEPAQIRAMLQMDLLKKLLVLLDSEYCGDVFWVLSNLIERIPGDIVPLITGDFVKRVLEIIDSSSYEIQKEGCFFLSTLIVVCNDAMVAEFMVQPVVGPLVEMLECGDTKTQMRCMQTLFKMVRTAANGDRSLRGRLLSLLDENELANQLGNLMEEKDAEGTSEKAEQLMRQFERLASG